MTRGPEQPGERVPGGDPGMEVLRVVRSVVAELGNERALRSVSLEARLDRDLGLASLERVELLLRLEKHFGVTVADGAVMEAETPHDLVRALSEATPGVAPQPAETRPGRVGTTVPFQRVGDLGTAQTLTEVLSRRGGEDPLRPHITLRHTKHGSEEVILFGALWRNAKAVARSLWARGIRSGDTIALMLRTEEAFFSVFMGSLLAGAIPVPIYPPVRLDRIREYGERQVRILKNAEARAIITFQSASALTRLLKPRIPSLDAVLTPEDLAPRPLRGEEEDDDFQIGSPSDAALIQYTSGSTGNPKGVLLTHANLLANIRAVGTAIAVRPDDVGVSWLPLYHDMGLIGSWLFCLYYGIPVTFLPPLAFLSRPERWLWAIHDRRATLSPAPNFAYELCARKIADAKLSGLDLSSWRIAFNGAEPVSPATIERFTARFGSYGFREEALLPVYGLAESSVALTVPSLGRPARIDRIAREPFEKSGLVRPASSPDIPSIRFVSCGRPLQGHTVRIVNDADLAVDEGVEGRIEFKGPSMMAGYYRNAEASAEVMRDGWIDTGDLGYLSDGELFITGRRKDIILKAGRNVYPQEIEEVAGNIPGIRRGFVAAFGVPDADLGTERLVVVAETRETREKEKDRLSAAVTERVSEAVGIPPDVVVLAAPGSVSKTSSGKIRRDACRTMFKEGQFFRKRRSARLQIAGLALGSAGAHLWGDLSKGIRHVYGLYARLVFIVTALPVTLLILLLPPRFAALLGRLWANVFLRLVGCSLMTERIVGRPPEGPVVYVANHAGEIDPIALLAALPAGTRMVAKREVLEMPLVRTFVRKAGHLTVDRQDRDRARQADRIALVLREGASVLFFPEGTYTRASGLRAFALGAFKAAIDAGVPVVPIGIRGTRVIYQEGNWPPRPGPIRIIMGQPIRPEGRDWKEMVRLRNAARADVGRLAEERPVDLVLPGPDPTGT